MPAPPAALGQILQVRIVCMLNTQIGLNILHYQVTSVSGASNDLQVIADTLAESFAAPFRAWLAPDARYIGVDVKQISPIQTITYSNGIEQGPGTNSGATLPPQVAALIATKGALAGKKYRGRIYIPFVPTGVSAGVEPGEVSDASAALLGAIAIELGPDIVIDNDPDITTISLLTSIKAPVSENRIEQTIVRRRLATQRRRGLFSASNLPPF